MVSILYDYPPHPPPAPPLRLVRQNSVIFFTLDLAELTVYDTVSLVHNHTVKLQSKKHVAVSLRSLGTAAHNILHVRIQILPINTFAAEFVRGMIAVSEKQVRQGTMASRMFIFIAAESQVAGTAGLY